MYDIWRREGGTEKVSGEMSKQDARRVKQEQAVLALLERYKMNVKAREHGP